MTKILYIPTGEYLKYINPETDYGFSEIILEHIGIYNPIFELYEICSLTEEQTRGYSDWLLANGIKVPAILEEFEIIYD